MSQINKNRNESSRNRISTFNSKLFLDIELSDENILSTTNTEDSEISVKTSSIQLNDYLSNDLIEELEFPSFDSHKNIEEKKTDNFPLVNSKEQENKNISKKNHIINNYTNNEVNKNNMKAFNSSDLPEYNPLIELVNKGYEFIPRNLYKIEENSRNNMKNFYSFSKINKFRKNKKDDWFCAFCNNLNYSFRVKCNRCGASKEYSDYYIFQKLREEENKNNNCINNSFYAKEKEHKIN